MISLEAKQNIVYTIAEEKLTDEDYDQMIPFLQEKIRSFGKIRWYFEMRSFKGWELSAAGKDLKFDFQHNENLEKIAMVGDKEWEEQMTNLMKPFARAEVKYFSLEARTEAKSWIESIER